MPQVKNKWQTAIVDDTLSLNPVGELLFAKITEEGGIWSCLVEKAVAELLLGGYCQLIGAPVLRPPR